MIGKSSFQPRVCLCCGKELPPATTKGTLNGWHPKCIRKFFGTQELPEIQVSERQMQQLVSESVNRGLTVPGVQKKLSLHLSQEKPARLTLVDYPTGYILKPQAAEYNSLPELEHLTMQMAERLHIQTVPHALVRLKDDYAYITRRIDRDIDRKTGAVSLYAMEDFCQLSFRLTQDKYRGSYENCAKVIQKNSGRTGLDLSEFLLRIVFSYVVGNSDMHLKNFSLRETAPGSREYQLSAAYDLLPVNVVLPEDEDQMALTLNGKKRNLHRKDFLALAESCDIPKKAADRMIEKTLSMRDEYLGMIENAMLGDEEKEAFRDLIVKRCEM